MYVRQIQARIASELIELRNKSVFAFFMFNALFVLVVFLLQLNKDQIHVNWPLGIRTNITYIEETSEVFTEIMGPRYKFMGTNYSVALQCTSCYARYGMHIYRHTHRQTYIHYGVYTVIYFLTRSLTHSVHCLFICTTGGMPTNSFILELLYLTQVSIWIVHVACLNINGKPQNVPFRSTHVIFYQIVSNIIIIILFRDHENLTYYDI